MNDLTQEEFDELIYDYEQAAVIFFHKDGCAVCVEVLRRLEGLLADCTLTFAGVNAIQERELFSRFGLRGVPQVLFFRDGRLLKSIAGNQNTEEYVTGIELLTTSGIESSQAEHEEVPEFELITDSGAMI